MAELITIARPYAKAAFEFACEKGQLATWSQMLDIAAQVAVNRQMTSCLDNPRLTAEQKADVFNAVCPEQNGDAGKNFIVQLARHKRLKALPEIHQLFERMMAEQQKTVDVQVLSAFPLGSAEISKLSASLEKKLGRKVKLASEVDASLLGGVVIKAGDMVIDGSVRGRLARLARQVA